MLDIDTLRFVQAITAACTFLLVYAGTYRRIRAPYAGWWSLAVIASSTSTLTYLAADLVGARAASAIGNGLAVVGASMIWASARSLRNTRTQWWVWAGPGVLTAAVSALEAPQGEAWPGGLTLLLGMAAMTGLAAVELWSLVREPQPRRSVGEPTEARVAMVAMAVTATTIASFYLARGIVFLTQGPDSALYQDWFGPRMTTLLITLMLVVVTYTVAELSRYEMAHHWRYRADHDSLTGLHNRAAFLDRAVPALNHAAAHGETVACVVADLDLFKEINDSRGHAAGDAVLVAFADACRAAVRTDDVVARLGGDEFVAILPHADAQVATRAIERISKEFALAGAAEPLWPTVSFGVAVGGGGSLDELMARADQALYGAKRAGRARTVVAAPREAR